MMIHLCNSYKTELFFDNVQLKTLAEVSDAISSQSSEILCRCMKGNPVAEMYP